MNQTQESITKERRYQFQQFPGLRATVKLIDPMNRTQIRIDISAVTTKELFAAIYEVQVEAVEQGYEIDHFPMGPEQDDVPMPGDPEYTFEHIDPEMLEEAQRYHQPAYLAGLFNENGVPLMELPAGAKLPTKGGRPQRWCSAHQQWMWQRSGNGGTWFSHPHGEQFCKGQKAS